MASQRIIRWAVLLRAYKYVILYRAGKDHGNAVSQSACSAREPKDTEPEEQVLMLDQEQSPLTTSAVAVDI